MAEMIHNDKCWYIFSKIVSLDPSWVGTWD
jgi:hypothetical protein